MYPLSPLPVIKMFFELTAENPITFLFTTNCHVININTKDNQMPLSINNNNHISLEELTAISNCNLTNELIVLQTDTPGRPKITTLPKSEVNCWQLFLRFFGCGKLANFQVHLSNIIPHLIRYDWKEAATIDPDTYSKVCTLANKALYSKEDELLFKNVSTESVRKSADFAIYREGFSSWRLIQSAQTSTV